MELIFSTSYTGSNRQVGINYQEPADTTRSVACSFEVDTSLYTINTVRFRWTQGALFYVVDFSSGAGGRGTAQSGTVVNLPVTGYTTSMSGNVLQGRFTATLGHREGYAGIYKDIQVVVDVTERPPATASTVTVETVNLCSAQTVSMSNARSDVHHQITWSYPGNVSHTEALAEGVWQASWAIEGGGADWQAVLLATPNSQTIQGTVTVVTYDKDGNTVGSAVTAAANLTIPEEAYATEAEWMAWSDVVTAGGQDLRNTQYINTITIEPMLTFAVGTSLVRIIYSAPDWTREMTTTANVTFRPQLSGVYRMTMTVEDSRGFVQTSELATNVAAYAAPVFQTLEAQRCLQAGTPDDEGIYALIRATTTGSSIGGAVTVTAQLLSTAGAEISAAETLTNGEAILSGLAQDNSYQIRIRAADQVMQQQGIYVETVLPIGITTHTIYRMAGGKGVAFGKRADKLGVEVREDWDLWTHGKEIRELILDTAHPPGSTLETFNPNFDPNTAWPWSVWREMTGLQLAGGSTEAQAAYRAWTRVR